jgi:hypothetical protein
MEGFVNREEVLHVAVRILAHSPNGLKRTQLIHEIRIECPRLSDKQVENCVWDLHLRNPNILRPKRGLFQHVNFRPDDTNDAD